QRPSPFKDAFRSGFLYSPRRVPLLGFREIDGNGGLASSAFQRVHTIPFVCEKMFYSRQQERAESAAVPVRIEQVVLFKQQREEFLRQVLALVAIVAIPPDEGVNRMPISLT